MSCSSTFEKDGLFGVIYCKCEGCKRTLSLIDLMPNDCIQMYKELLAGTPPPIPEETCDSCDVPCGNDWCCMKEKK